MSIQLEIEVLDHCPMCGNATGLRELLVTRDFESGTGDYPIQECPACSLAFTNPRPSEASLPLLYSGRDTPDFATGSKGIAQRLRDISIRSYLRKRLPESSGKPLEVLDFGCGDGSLSFHAAMSPGQPVVTSVDFHDKAPALVGETNGRASYRSYWQWREGGGRYDVVFLRHVLEHHPEPTRLLTELFQALKPQGMLHIEVPNRRSVWARVFGRNFFAYYVPRHLMHFDTASVKQAIEGSGLTAIEVRKGHTPLIGRSMGNALSRDIDNLGVLGLSLFPLQILADVLFGRSTTLRALARK
ncbi:methyltransferase domain-containing protein [Lysobacter soli]|uniref:class I SAM-dependent methyltransferase n=1 Tax=Lysobacter soli TaxID=453783 RepID=UPI0012EDDC13|nr:class I SAM-dependent methyltransferase [Lysobacter soli]QGW64063.1 methyltransferase domain-containing protein [Lysobacter soli]